MSNNYQERKVSETLYKKVCRIFKNYVFHREKEGSFFLKTHKGQRNILLKYYSIELEK